MKKHHGFYYFILSTTLMVALAYNNYTYAKEYKSPYGNYSMNIPENATVITEGPTSYRFAQGNVKIECNIISLPQEMQANKDSINNTERITKLDNLLLSSIADINYQKTNSSWQKYKNKELLYQTFENKAADNLNNEKLLADTIFLNNKKIFVISAFAPNTENERASQLLATILNSIKINDSKEYKTNYFKNFSEGYSIDLPINWYSKANSSQNIIQLQRANTIDNKQLTGSIRTFSTSEYAQFAKAAEPDLSKMENHFIERMTKYASNQTVINHKPININGLNGILVEKTINKQDEVINLIECYLFTANKGYQINFSVKDKMQYDLSKNDFINSILSFKTLVY